MMMKVLQERRLNNRGQKPTQSGCSFSKVDESQQAKRDYDDEEEVVDESQSCDACTVSTHPISPSSSCAGSDLATDSKDFLEVGSKSGSNDELLVSSKQSDDELLVSSKQSGDQKEKSIEGGVPRAEKDDKSRKGANKATQTVETSFSSAIQETKERSAAAAAGTQTDSQPQIVQHVAQKIQFEAEYTGLAATTLLCYCLAHITIYELIYAILLELTDDFEHYTLLYAGLMLTGLLLLRSTGFLWYFLSGKCYRATKKERTEQLKRGSWDARFHTWIENREVTKTVLEVVGFYLCYISLAFFWNNFLTSFVDQKEELFKLLPSTQYHERMLSGLVDDGGYHQNVNMNATENTGTCEEPINWDSEDADFLYRNVAKSSYYPYSGSGSAPLFSAPTAMLVFGSVASFSIYCLSKLGFAFQDNW